MILNVYAVYDSKIKDYANPFYLHSDGEAERGFSEVVNDPHTKLNKYAADYHLYKLGTYDSEKGLISPFQVPEHLFHALSLKQQPIL